MFIIIKYRRAYITYCSFTFKSVKFCYRHILCWICIYIGHQNVVCLATWTEITNWPKSKQISFDKGDFTYLKFLKTKILKSIPTERDLKSVEDSYNLSLLWKVWLFVTSRVSIRLMVRVKTRTNLIFSFSNSFILFIRYLF